MNEYLFENDTEMMLMDEWRKIIFYHKARTVLPLLFDGIKYSNRKVFVEYFEKFYGKFTDTDSALDRINLAIRQLNEKLKAIEEDQKSNETTEKFSLWDLIIGVEHLLGTSIPKDINLIAFKRYMKKASSYARKN